MSIILTTDSKELIDLKDLKNITMIHLSSLEKDYSLKIIPGFIVDFEGHTINYTVAQDHFEEFVARLRQVYLEEKNNNISDGMGIKHIEIDPLTEKVLLEGKIEKAGEIYNYYHEQEGYEESLLFDEDRIRARLPIIIYHLKETAKLLKDGITSETLKITDITPNKDLTVLHVKVNKVPKRLKLEDFEIVDENEWKIKIVGLLSTPSSIEIDSRFKPDDKQLVVSCSIKKIGVFDETVYEIGENNIFQKRNAYNAVDQVHFSCNTLEEVNKEEAEKWLIQDAQKHDKWFKLPWGGYIGTSEKIELLGTRQVIWQNNEGNRDQAYENDLITSTELILITPTEESLYINETIFKRFCRKVNDIYITKQIPLDRMRREITGVVQYNKLLLETAFSGIGILGYYSKHLTGKYFYHIAKPKSIMNTINFIGRNDGLYESDDLLVNKKIYERGNK